MTPHRSNTDYAAKAAEAEEASKSVKDPELRRVAFEKILAHLLETGATTPDSTRAAPEKPAKSSPGKRKSTKRAGTAKNGPKARVAALIDEDYFKKQRSIADVKTELANRGHHIPMTSLSGPLQSLVREKLLRREKVTSNGKGSKTTYAYSNW